MCADRWLLQGELSDPHCEFFIGVNSNASAASIQNVWRDTYFLRPSMLPVFLPLEIAKRILVIGKTNNFLKLCLPRLSGNKAEGQRDKGPSVPAPAGDGKVRSPAPSYREVNKSKRLTTGARVVDTPIRGAVRGTDRHADTELEPHDATITMTVAQKQVF